jgi:hypothetical protein
MKTVTSIIIITALFCMAPPPTARGQEGPDDAIKRLSEATRRAEEEARQQADLARELQLNASKLGEEVASSVAQEVGAGPYVDRLQTIIRHGPAHGGNKSLVVRWSDLDPKDEAGLEEDLAVMSHILEKAAGAKPGATRQVNSAMGIDVVFGFSLNAVQSVYLEGYGALFTVNVSFPLLPPPKAEAPKPNTATDSAWEEAREELYGSPGEAKAIGQPGEEYDEGKVTKLKDSLVEALKNASNIRGLKPDDSITVCVLGSPGPAPARFNKQATTARRELFLLDNPPRARGTILTLHVKKSDADAFAKDKMTLEEFRKKVKLSTYAGNTERGNVFGASSGGGFGAGFSRSGAGVR